MALYRTTDQAVYLSDKGLMVYVGQEFTTDAVPGSTWEPLDKDAIAKVKAKFPEKYPPVKGGAKALPDTEG